MHLVKMFYVAPTKLHYRIVRCRVTVETHHCSVGFCKPNTFNIIIHMYLQAYLWLPKTRTCYNGICYLNDLSDSWISKFNQWVCGILENQGNRKHSMRFARARTHTHTHTHTNTHYVIYFSIISRTDDDSLDDVSRRISP